MVHFFREGREVCLPWTATLPEVMGAEIGKSSRSKRRDKKKMVTCGFVMGLCL